MPHPANGNAPPDSGSTDRSSNLVVYLERLQVALTAVEQRIAVLSGNQNEGVRIVSRNVDTGLHAYVFSLTFFP